MAKAWQLREEQVLRDKYLTHTAQELVLALMAEGFDRTTRAVVSRCCELGLCRSDDMLPFCYQLTLYCDAGDPFISKVEGDLRKQETPYIVVSNNEGQQAIFCQPLNGKVSREPDRKWWARWYKHPVSGTWPSYA